MGRDVQSKRRTDLQTVCLKMMKGTRQQERKDSNACGKMFIFPCVCVLKFPKLLILDGIKSGIHIVGTCTPVQYWKIRYIRGSQARKHRRGYFRRGFDCRSDTIVLRKRGSRHLMV